MGRKKKIEPIIEEPPKIQQKRFKPNNRIREQIIKSINKIKEGKLDK